MDRISFQTAKVLNKSPIVEHFKWATAYMNNGDISTYTNEENLYAPPPNDLRDWFRKKGIDIWISSYYYTDVNEMGYNVEEITYCEDGDLKCIILHNPQDSFPLALDYGLQQAILLYETLNK